MQAHTTFQSHFPLQALYVVSELLIWLPKFGLEEMEIQMAWKKRTQTAIRDNVPFYFVEIKLLYNPQNINI